MKFILVYLLVLMIAVGVFGVVGMFTWPYTINTWASYSELDKKPEYKPIGRGMGFLLGICPVVGQISVPAAIITGVCDYIFIPDPDEVVLLESN